MLIYQYTFNTSKRLIKSKFIYYATIVKKKKNLENDDSELDTLNRLLEHSHEDTCHLNKLQISFIRYQQN